MLEKISEVDEVVVQNEVMYGTILEQLKPDYVIHGDNWLNDPMEVIRDNVIENLNKWGGKLIEVPYTYNENVKNIEAIVRERAAMPEFRRKRLRQLLKLCPIVKTLEVHSGLTGLIAEKTIVANNGEIDQFDAMWLSSLCDSTAKGKPDIELVDMSSRLRTVDDILEVTTKPIILDGLSKLEYRGYDSAGIAVFDGEKIITQKAVGRLKILENLTCGGERLKGFSGIGHTRWATHGAPSEKNAHPHRNKTGTIAVVHNGIIENYSILKKKMQNKGYEFISDTDTEVLAHLLDYYYQGNPLETIIKVLHRVEGSYALGIMFADHPEAIYAVRKDSPMIVGKNDKGCFIASDVPAILKYTRTVYYVDNQEVVELKKEGMCFYSIDEEKLVKEPVTVEWDVNAAEKAGYEYFMLKEIYEQPATVNNTILPRIKGNEIVINELGISDDELCKVEKIHIVACGSAYHVGMTGKYIIEGLAQIPVDVDVASEFRYRDPILQKGDMVIVISQSGETADTLAALRETQKKGRRGNGGKKLS